MGLVGVPWRGVDARPVATSARFLTHVECAEWCELARQLRLQESRDLAGVSSGWCKDDRIGLNTYTHVDSSCVDPKDNDELGCCVCVWVSGDHTRRVELS